MKHNNIFSKYAEKEMQPVCTYWTGKPFFAQPSSLPKIERSILASDWYLWICRLGMDGRPYNSAATLSPG